jgi:putrescine transport system substrate-binding protein
MLASREFRAFAALSVFAFCLSALPAGAQKERVLNVYNWSDYVDPQVLQDFAKETGIKLRYDTFDSNDTLEARLLAGKSGYDVVVPTAYFLERQIKAGLFQIPGISCSSPRISRSSRIAA